VETLQPLGRDSFPIVLAGNPDGSKVYTFAGRPTTLYEIATPAGGLQSTSLKLDSISDMVVRPSGQQAYLADTQRNLVYLVDLTSYTIQKSIPVGDTPTGMAVGITRSTQGTQPGGPVAATAATWPATPTAETGHVFVVRVIETTGPVS
jgi:YVTN family beta-propeller protein